MATILIVDDSALCRQFLKAVLQYSQHTLLEAEEGQQALEIIKQGKPDLIITDLLMPTMNGYQLVQEIKQNPELSAIPILFYTASFLMDEARLLADTCDVKHVLYKPCDPKIVQNTINDILKEVNTTHTDPKLVKQHETELKKLISQNFHKSGQINRLKEHVADLLRASNNFHRVIKIFQSSTEDTDKDFLQSSLNMLTANQQFSLLSYKLLSIFELTFEMMNQRHPKPLLTMFADRSRILLNSDYCVIAIFKETTIANPYQLKFFVFSSHDRGTEIHYGDMPQSGTLLHRIMQSNEVIKLDTIDQITKSEFHEGHPDVNSLLGTKLATMTNVYGYIYFANAQLNKSFTNVDKEILGILAAQSAFLYEYITMYEVIQRYAAQLQVSVNDLEKKISK